MSHENESAPAAATAQGAPDDDRLEGAIDIQDTDEMTAAQLEFHPLVSEFPPLEGQEFEELAADIKANGQREPIVLYEDKILDGRNRYNACLALGIEPRFSRFEHIAAPGDTPEAYVLSANAHRRHLTVEDKRRAIAKLVAAHPEKSDRSLAKMAGVSDKTIAKARPESTADDSTVEKPLRVGADGKKRKAPKKLTKAQKEEQREKRRKKAQEKRRADHDKFDALMPDGFEDMIADAQTASEEFDDIIRRNFPQVDLGDASLAAGRVAEAWVKIADAIIKKAKEAAPVTGNDVNPAASADAMKAAHAQAKPSLAPAAKKKRGRPPGSKNKRK